MGHADRENAPVDYRNSKVSIPSQNLRPDFLAASDPLPEYNTFIEFRPARPTYRRGYSMPDPRMIDGASTSTSIQMMDHLEDASSSRNSKDCGDEEPIDFVALLDDDYRERNSPAVNDTRGEGAQGGVADGRASDEVVNQLRDRIPRDQNGNFTSIGSIYHACNQCKPCVFAHNAEKACANGIACEFCHFYHEPRKRTRASKKKRIERKTKALELERGLAAGSDHYTPTEPDDDGPFLDDPVNDQDGVSLPSLQPQAKLTGAFYQ
jgi:hypothetical protein